ncbi:acyl-CoA synthetase FdrA [Motilimonas cestriensis]|uniref:Acyl-CoA synthetase FdrA n=1 Tax=Motilimonas cestriensis TaxID=2742685 RepID=A0ABS8W827_9GAMM|nr:acyl-CoA synthetase FdrA [Motilimonas cestriensis]MCE2593959.1 acyl-CoA synthetase FdrA [Motilimonas cestriensis]
MVIKYKAFENLYQDSVSLMQISARLNKIVGVDEASVVMGTEANLSRMADAGFGDNIVAKPNDLVIAVKGEEEACNTAIEQAQQALTAKPDEGSGGASFSPPLTSFALGLEQHADANLALISVPGEYAAAEAIKALNLGLNVMMFSDNVSLADELQIKQLAQKKALMVMGPDCGTAIINGIPLGFANVVRRGAIGVVAASGTGLQEATCRIHQLGGGVSQAMGTGGHDLHQDIGGISMLQGLLALAEDDATKVIVLISKPPAAAIAERILATAAQVDKPVVVHFLGQADSQATATGVYFAHSLAHSAEVAVAVLRNQALPNAQFILSAQVQEQVTTLKTQLTPTQRYIRGVFAGGTFCFEAQIIASQYGLSAFSNTPIQGNHCLEDVWTSQQHTIVDLGDDDFTQGRPHPMIDPSLRNQRMLQDARDASTAVILFDVVLGYGASEEPLAELLDTLDQIRNEQVSMPALIAHVCGTDLDPQARDVIRQALEDAGVIIADSNADAAHLAAYFVSQLG